MKTFSFKKLRRFFLFSFGASLIAVCFNNCGPSFTTLQSTEFSSSAFSDSSSTSGPGEIVSEIELGKSLYQTNCLTCHGTLDKSAKKGKDASEISNAISVQAPMKMLSFLTQTEIAAIALALSGSPVQNITGDVTVSRPTISNRFAAASLLQELFVADTGKNASDTQIEGFINTYITNRPEAFGGNCSRNDAGCIPKPCGLSDSSCIGKLGSSQNAEVVPTAGSVRRGYMIQVCEKILAIDKSVTNLLGKAQINSTTAPTAATITNLLQFILPGQTLNPAIPNKLKDLATDANTQGMNTLEQWRFVILPICQSNYIELI